MVLNVARDNLFCCIVYLERKKVEIFKMAFLQQPEEKT
jgi:hypothetical protein